MSDKHPKTLEEHVDKALDKIALVIVIIATLAIVVFIIQL